MTTSWRLCALGVTLFGLAAFSGCGGSDDGAPPSADDLVHLNEVQVLGTHNSYHIQPRAALYAILIQLSNEFLAWEYTHLPLGEQFEEQGIRQIELDVYADPNGGLYSQRHGLKVIMQPIDSGLPELDEPGFKVLHVQDLDFETTCLTFVDCLQEVKTWSDAHPSHLPIMIEVELKDETIPDPFKLGFVTPVFIGAEELDALDAEIRSVFPPSQLITPDDVRRGRPTLEDAVLNLGWPTLREARGRILFTIDNGDDKGDLYRAGHPSLEGRVMFTNATPGNPDAAFVKLNDPIGDGEMIRERVAQGYVVRTRADGDTVEARSGNTAPRDAAFASGAQWVSTDYPVPNPAFGTGYYSALPGGGVARCNPINAPEGCESDLLE